MPRCVETYHEYDIGLLLSATFGKSYYDDGKSVPNFWGNSELSGTC